MTGGLDMMRALRKLDNGTGRLDVVEVPVPEPGEGEARIAVFAAGVCGTDLHIIDGSYASSPPVTLGHEIAGRVESVGTGVDPGWIGRRVAPEPAIGCGTCEWCASGFPMHCRRRTSLGTHVDGGFATYVVVPVRNLHALPDSLSDAAGALVEPLACVCHALFKSGSIVEGSRVIVTGPGTIGILAAQVAVACGARTTLVGLDRDALRLSIASEMGLDARSLDSSETRESLEVEVNDRMIDVVIECSGAEAAVVWALASLRPRGHLVQLGLLPEDVSVTLAGAVLREVTLTSSYGSNPESWQRAVDLLTAGSIQLDPLVTSTLPLQDWADAVQRSQAQEGIKTLFDPRLP